MTHLPQMAQVAALVGDPGRAAILGALLDGSVRTAGELARVAGVAPPTAQGPYRYFRLASPNVARMLEAVIVVAGPSLDAMPCHLPQRWARTCYDHLGMEVAP